MRLCPAASCCAGRAADMAQQAMHMENMKKRAGPFGLHRAHTQSFNRRFNKPGMLNLRRELKANVGSSQP